MKTRNSIVILLVSILFLTATLAPATFLAETADAKTDPFAIALNHERDYLIVVNDNTPYDFDGIYDNLLQGDLVYISDVYGEATPVEKATALAFTQLQVALREKGLVIGLYSGYRTEADQGWVYNYYSNLEGWKEMNKVLKPGYSEHHTGLLLNIMILHPDDDGDDVWFTETAERQKTIPEFRILHETLADFGFIDRYPEGKEDITGIPCEPYEIRFVGSSFIAHTIMDNDLCLEEYLAGN